MIIIHRVSCLLHGISGVKRLVSTGRSVIDMSYRVYITSHIRGLFDEDVYDYRVDYLPSYSLGQIDKLIKDLNDNQTGISVTPKRWEFITKT